MCRALYCPMHRLAVYIVWCIANQSDPTENAPRMRRAGRELVRAPLASPRQSLHQNCSLRSSSRSSPCCPTATLVRVGIIPFHAHCSSLGEQASGIKHRKSVEIALSEGHSQITESTQNTIAANRDSQRASETLTCVCLAYPSQTEPALTHRYPLSQASLRLSLSLPITQSHHLIRLRSAVLLAGQQANKTPRGPDQSPLALLTPTSRHLKLMSTLTSTWTAPAFNGRTCIWNQGCGLLRLRLRGVSELRHRHGFQVLHIVEFLSTPTDALPVHRPRLTEC